MPQQTATSIPSAERTPPSGLAREQVAAGIVIAAIAFLAYFPSLGGEFIYEDAVLLADNPLIHAPDGFFRAWITTDQPDYVPLTSTTLWLEWRLWHLNSTGYHVTNLVLHVAACFVLWLLLRKLAIPGAFLAALLYAIHPVNVESVAWIEQRKDTLSTLLFLLSIWWYLKAEEGPGAGWGRWYWLALLAFALAMFSKGSVATLPVALLLVIWWQRGRWTLRDLLRSAPFFLVSAVLTPVIIWFVAHGTGQVVREVTFVQRLLQAGTVVWFYLAKALAPIKLIFFYPLWDIQADELLWWLPLAATLAVTALLVGRRNSPQSNWLRPLLFGWGFFCVALAPAMGFFDPGYMKFSLVADHYQHLALLAVVSLIAAGMSVWHERAQGWLRGTAALAAAAIVGGFTLLTWQQASLYDNDIHLYEVTLKDNPCCWMAHQNFGNSLAAKGRIQEAIDHYRLALRLKPDYVAALNSLGKALCDIGRPDDGIEQYRQAMRLNPDYALTYYNLAVELADRGQPEMAIQQYRQALRIRPDFPAALTNLGNALLETGHPDEALEQYRQAVQINPDFVMAQFNLGNSMFSAGRLDEAMEHFRHALHVRPDFAEARYNLGIALAKAGRTQEAIVELQHTLRLRPHVAEIHNNLGNALVEAGRPAEAIEQYRQALRLKPDFNASYLNLTNTYAALHRPAEAITTAKEALEMARSQGNDALVIQFENLINNYRAQQAEAQDAAPPSSDLSH